MAKGSISLGRIYGIEVDLHYSLFLIFALIAWSLATTFFPVNYEGLGMKAYALMGIAAAILLFASVLLHEFSHSLVALANKIKVSSITLFFFGGVAQVKEEGFTPGKEFKIAVAGPAFSLLFALVFYALARLSLSVYITGVASYLFRLNMMLGVFNLVPGFPLDGGRMLRAILWKKYNDIVRATYVAAKGGKMFATFLIFFGIMGLFFGRLDIWYILIGIFLYSVSKETYRQTVIKSVLEKVKVSSIIKKQFKSLDPDTLISRINFKYFVKYEQETFPVMKGKSLLGVTRLSYIEQAKQAGKKAIIKDITIPLHKIKVLQKDEDGYKAMELMMAQNLELLPVFDKKKFIGLAKFSVLAELLKLNAEKPEKK